MEKILEFINVTKIYKNFILDNVSFSLEKGAIMGFVGENGAGKTTTIKLMINAIGKNSGEINIFGKDNDKEEVFIKNNIGYVPDEDYFEPRSNLMNYAKALEVFYDNWSYETFKKYVDLWRLPLDKKIGEYSKGMKTKAMIALALAHNPRLLILDEPTADLDPVARQELLDVLRDFVADGEKSVFFSTHITSDLDKVADYITIIHRGRILETMSMDQLEEKYVLLQGGIEQLKSLDKEFVGIKKGSVTFEGIITRDKANKFFPDIKGSKPNVESILTYSIWGDSNGRG